jgi:hypothetical protein
MRIGITGLGALLALAALPAGAAAKPHTFVHEPTRFADFTFPGTHGYKFEVGVGGSGESESSNAVINARNGIYNTGYFVDKATLGDDGRLRAQLPGTGKIDLRFIPGHTQFEPNEQGCEGKPTRVEHGTFRGTIQIKGRQDYTSAHRSSVNGTISEDFKQVCKESGAQSARAAAADDFNSTSLVVGGSKSGRFTRFFVDRFETNNKPEAPEFTAGTSIIHTGYSFFSEVDLPGKQASFIAPDLKGLSEATAEPPAPFTGSAEFKLLPDGKSSWKGDLAVDLPGFRKTPLTGAGFLSDLCHGDRCTESKGAE